MTYKNKFNRNLRKAKEKLYGTGEVISDKMNDVQYTTAKYVRRNPLKTVGYSMLAGVLLATVFQLRK